MLLLPLSVLFGLPLEVPTAEPAAALSSVVTIFAALVCLGEAVAIAGKGRGLLIPGPKTDVLEGTG